MISSGNYSFTIQTNAYTVARHSCTNGSKRNQSQPESRGNQWSLQTSRCTDCLPQLVFTKYICKCTRPSHTPTSQDHPRGYAISRPNPGSSRRPAADARPLPLSYASQRCEFRESEWGTTNSETEEETTGVMKNPYWGNMSPLGNAGRVDLRLDVERRKCERRTWRNKNHALWRSGIINPTYRCNVTTILYTCVFTTTG